MPTPVFLGFSAGSAGKEFACSAGDLGSISGLEKKMTALAGILACKISWTEEPDRIQSTRLQGSDTTE